MDLPMTRSLQHAFTNFFNKSPVAPMFGGYANRPDRVKLSRGNDRSVVTSVYNRLALDAAAVNIRHVKTDKDGNYLEEINSELNDCLSLDTNLDQTATAFFQDVYMSLFDEGEIAIVPVKAETNSLQTEFSKIKELRVGKIKQWYPHHVKVELYDEDHMQKKEIILPKKLCAIVENPFYAVMNEGNSTVKRLIRKMNMLDSVDEQASSGKLDLIIQLPYLVKSDARRKQAEQRRKDIENQLAGSKYGIAYTDGTEHITQLNRSLDNNLMKQVEYLTSLMFSQLGITQEIMDGTADEKVMTNYYSRTIYPIVKAVTDSMRRTFLTKTARTQGQSIQYFRDPFLLVGVTDIAELADKLTRNEITTSNEIRQKIGFKPSSDPKADQLINSNISQSKQDVQVNGFGKTDEGTQSEMREQARSYLRRQQE